VRAFLRVRVALLCSKRDLRHSDLPNYECNHLVGSDLSQVRFGVAFLAPGVLPWPEACGGEVIQVSLKHSATEAHVPMLSVHQWECLPGRRTHVPLHHFTHDLHKRELSCVQIPRNDVSVVADGLRGIVQRTALQQARDKLVALGV